MPEKKRHFILFSSRFLTIVQKKRMVAVLSQKLRNAQVRNGAARFPTLPLHETSANSLKNRCNATGEGHKRFNLAGKMERSGKGIMERP